jgi:histidyl-tRNA synthetase
LRIVHEWRQAGQRVQVEVNGRTLEETLSYARKVGIPQVLVWNSSGFDTYEIERLDDTNTTTRNSSN